ncbi:hypothetical protein CSUI_004941 [Cystoisospora suis]|uniref:Uncharacterized protein n=1 Tax=Cystoisospora suis TaxID=483139 RepID=A0A2C6KZQ6_9APIC|nr:hypothetical protein CSUI_004941 [Cystoisospora suis]
MLVAAAVVDSIPPARNPPCVKVQMSKRSSFPTLDREACSPTFPTPPLEDSHDPSPPHGGEGLHCHAWNGATLLLPRKSPGLECGGEGTVAAPTVGFKGGKGGLWPRKVEGNEKRDGECDS